VQQIRQSRQCRFRVNTSQEDLLFPGSRAGDYVDAPSCYPEQLCEKNAARFVCGSFDGRRIYAHSQKFTRHPGQLGFR
jgi:hypothetical protein